MNSFDPVQLIAPDGSFYVARNAVDLNDRIAEGYRRNSARPRTPRPSPHPVPSQSLTVTDDAEDDFR